MESSANVTKSAWNVVREFSNKAGRKQYHLKIKDGNTIVEDPTDVANRFNDFFINVPKSISDRVPKMRYGDHIVRNNNTMFLFPFTEEEFLTLIGNKLKPKASSGFDDIPGFLLKKCLKDLSGPLVCLVNRSFSSGIFPNKLKTNKVVPLLKKGDRELIENYRPIALSPVFSKIFEYCYLDRLQGFLDRYDILVENQFGFRRERGTKDAIHAFVEYVVEHIESGECPVGLFCDLSRAFDCVVHELLLVKAEKYGVRGRALEWLTSYLTGRRQYVSVGHAELGLVTASSSTFQAVDVGVPQGSILGPVLFILYINDLAGDLDCNLCMYADDATATVSGQNNSVVEARAQENLDRLHAWFGRNLLHMNPSKTDYVIFHNYNNKNLNIGLTLDGAQLNRQCSVRFLGVTVDENLNWKSHCDSMCSKLNSLCFLIRNLKVVLTTEQLLSVYHAHISARLRYGVCFWGASAEADNVFLCQKRIVRCIAGISGLTSCRDYFRNLKILTLASLVVLELATLTYQNQGKLLRGSDIHAHDTRTKDNLRLPNFQYRIGRKSPMYMGIEVFNSLNDDIKKSVNVNVFKQRLKALLLQGSFYSVEEFLTSQG